MNSLIKNPFINFTGKSTTTNIIPVNFVNNTDDFFDTFSNPFNDSLNNIYNNGITQIGNLATDFFNGIKNNGLYTEPYLNSLSILIKKQRSNNELINKLLLFLQKLITVFRYGYDLYTENIYLKERLEECRERASILDDYEKLKKYVSEFNNRLYIIENQNVNMTKSPVIKKEYLGYINKYGVPENGVFDYSKLQEFFI